MLQTGGFVLEVLRSDPQRPPLNARVSSLPEEHGPNVVHGEGVGYSWLAFTPAETVAPLVEVRADTNEAVVLFSGSVYSGQSVDDLRRGFLAADDEASLARLLNRISGPFCGVVYRKDDGRAYGFTDQFGLCKLFVDAGTDRLRFGSNLYVLAALRDEVRISGFARASTVYCGHTFTGTVFTGIDQVSAACIASAGNGEPVLTEYTAYPEIVGGRGRDVIARVAEAHRDCWRRLGALVDGDVTLLLSRGKDARVTLKSMLDVGLSPHVMSFYRKNNPLKPFTSFLLDSTDDYQVAERTAAGLDVTFQAVEIPNRYLLDNLERIVGVTYGTPLHWEFLAAAEALQDRTRAMTTGYVGDAIAGKSHHYYVWRRIRTRAEYAAFEFASAGDAESYAAVRGVLAEAGRSLPDVDELAAGWRAKYELCRSDDINMIYQQGLFRTRVEGRTGPTFHQARLFAVQLYPYLDLAVLNAYRALPEKWLRWERAHVALIKDDPAFNRESTTRLAIDVKKEYALLDAMGLLRRLDMLVKGRRKKIGTPDPRKNDALSEALQAEGLPAATVGVLLEKTAVTGGGYATLANLVAALRIERTATSLAGARDRRTLQFTPHREPGS